MPLRDVSCALGNRVITAWMPRMTPAHPPDSEPGATQGAMTFDGLPRILRTTGAKTTAIANQRTDGVAISLDEPYQHLLHELAPIARFATLLRVR